MQVLRLRLPLIVSLQSLLIAFSLFLSWMLRFEFQLVRVKLLLVGMLLLVPARIAALAYFGLLRGYWRFTGVNDVGRMMWAAASGSILFFTLVRGAFGLKQFPLSIFILEGLISTHVLLSVRLASRLLADHVLRAQPGPPRRRVLVIGANLTAHLLVQQLQQPGSEFEVVAILDDDPKTYGTRINGIMVEGSIASLPSVVLNRNIQEVLFAMPSASGKDMDWFVQLCEQARVPYRTVPTLSEIMNAGGDVNLRQVKVEDLLGRNQVEMDIAPVRELLKDAIIMVTGAAGSIGSELCMQILRYRPRRLVCVDQNETGIFHLQTMINRTYGSCEACFCVSDIADAKRMQSLLETERVKFILHAAAYKHVPLVEDNVREAVKNNIFATLQLLEVAESAGCEGFLFISSDKAVCPSSFMGCTKRTGELIMSGRPASRMRCVSVRFGNVLGSQGSVVPLFQEQLRREKKIHVTHPDMKRYFMTIPEAVSLVLTAFTVGEHGDLMVLDMGDPMLIVELARKLIRLSGYPESSVRIEFTGLRPGEKLFEELSYSWESLVPTSMTRVRRTTTPKPSWKELRTSLEDLRTLMESGGESDIRTKMRQIVPEYEWVPEMVPMSVSRQPSTLTMAS